MWELHTVAILILQEKKQQIFSVPQKKGAAEKKEKAKILMSRNIPHPVIGAMMPFSTKSFLYRRAAFLRLSTTALH